MRLALVFLASCWSGPVSVAVAPVIVPRSGTMLHAPPRCLFTTPDTDWSLPPKYPAEPELDRCLDPDEDYWWCRSVAFETYAVRVRWWVESAIERCNP